MTNFDPLGFLLLFTVIPAVGAGIISITVAQLAARLGVGRYERTVFSILAVLIVLWIVTAVLVSLAMLQILAVVLAMVGAFAVTRNLRSTSYGWVLGVVLLYFAFTVLGISGIYRGVDQLGRPQGLIARHVAVFYYGGLLLFGAIGGTIAELVRSWW
ncbi:MAG: hypothetical protein ABEH64_13585 [Salinirussus sp.]